MAQRPFNPLDKLNLAKSLAEAMLQTSALPLPPEDDFSGAGIYALYYHGNYAPYRPVAAKNRGKNPTEPIHVGKAVPPGARKGGFGLGIDPGRSLLKRLREHARSINEASNLQAKDFSCRYLVCDDIWIPLGEALLIGRFQPPWNVLIQGFGIHTPGRGRKKQVRSMWDTIHVGRKFAEGLPSNPISEATILKRLNDFFKGEKVPVLTPEQAILEEEKDIAASADTETDK
jgi:hypothetical protein